MATPLRRNHYIPKFMLRYWASRPPGQSYTGVWTYEIATKKKSLANAQGGTAFSFAIVDDLYVPRIDDERATAIERWLADLEAALAAMARQMHAKSDPLRFKSLDDLRKAISALFALECRSPHTLERVRAAVENEPALVDVVGGQAEASPHQTALQNLISYVTEKTLAYWPPQIEILYVTQGGLLISDRPYFNHDSLPQRFMVVTNKVFLAMEKSPRPSMQYRYNEATPGLVEQLNRHTAMEARNWIAAETEELLDRYILFVESEEYRRYRASDRVVVEPVNRIATGWIIPRDGQRS